MEGERVGGATTVCVGARVGANSVGAFVARGVAVSSDDASGISTVVGVRVAILARQAMVGRVAFATAASGVGTWSGADGLGSICKTRTRALSIFNSSHSPETARTTNAPKHSALNNRVVRVNQRIAGRASRRDARRRGAKEFIPSYGVGAFRFQGARRVWKTKGYSHNRQTAAR